MTPLTLLGFIGPAVQLHICETMHAAYPDRFYVSTSLAGIAKARLRGYLDKSGTVLPEAAALLPQADAGLPAPGAESIRARILDALAEEVGLMLAENVVAGPADVDLCMLLGANFPEHQGGLTPMLDLSGASRRVWGKEFHPGPGFTDLATARGPSKQAPPPLTSVPQFLPKGCKPCLTMTSPNRLDTDYYSVFADYSCRRP